MTNTTTQRSRPPRTDKQLTAYAKQLAEERGQSLTLPRNRREALGAISRLKLVPPTPLDEAREERRQVRDDMATQRGDAARVRDHEIAGHGSTAHYDRTTLLATYTALDGTEHELRGRWTDHGRYRVMDHGEHGPTRFVTEQKKHSKLKAAVKVWIANNCKGSLDYSRLDEHLH